MRMCVAAGIVLVLWASASAGIAGGEPGDISERPDPKVDIHKPDVVVSKTLRADAYSTRANHIIDEIVQYGYPSSQYDDGRKVAGYAAIAAFRKYELTGDVRYRDMGRDWVHRHLGRARDMFWVVNQAAVYHMYKRYYTMALRNDVKARLCVENLYLKQDRSRRGTTENHALMYACSAILNRQEWGDDFPTNAFRVWEDWLTDFCNRVPAKGYNEQNSPTYIVHHVQPILMLHEHAQSDVKPYATWKKKARMILEYYFASLFSQSIPGTCVAATTREYETGGSTPYYNSAVNVMLWLLTGRGRTPPFHNRADQWGNMSLYYESVEFAAAPYRVPRVIQNLALDRTSPYLHRETAGDSGAITSYMSADYGVSSAWKLSSWPGCQVRVTWYEDTDIREPTRLYVTDQVESNISGHRGHMRAIQHNGTVVVTAYVDEDPRHLLVAMPKASPSSGVAGRIEEDGWIFLDCRKVLIGIRPTSSYEWVSDANIGRWYFTMEQLNRIRIAGERVGAVIETAPESDYAGDSNTRLGRFKHDVLAKCTIDTRGMTNARPRLVFRNLDGVELINEYEGTCKINDAILNFDEWPAMENRWVTCEQGKRILNIRYGGCTRRLDFNSWTVSAQ